LYFAAGGGAPIFLSGPQGVRVVGFTTPRHLPGGGGLLDQAAIMADAWWVIRQAVTAWHQQRSGS
jgi:hypothetical protein